MIRRIILRRLKSGSVPATLMLRSGSDKPLAGLWLVLVSGSAHLTDEKNTSRKQRTIGKFQTDREGALTRRVDSAEYDHFFWIAAGVSCSWTCCVRRQDGMEGHFGGLCCVCVATLVRFFLLFFCLLFLIFCFLFFATCLSCSCLRTVRNEKHRRGAVGLSPAANHLELLLFRLYKTGVFCVFSKNAPFSPPPSFFLFFLGLFSNVFVLLI